MSTYETRAKLIDASDVLTDVLFDHVQKRYPVAYKSAAVIATAVNLNNVRTQVGPRLEVSTVPDRVPKIRVENITYGNILDTSINKNEVFFRNNVSGGMVLTRAVMQDVVVPPLDDTQFARLILDGYGNDKRLQVVDDALEYDTRRIVPDAAVRFLPPSFFHFVIRIACSDHRLLSIDSDSKRVDSLLMLSPVQRATIHAMITTILPIAVGHSDSHFQFNTMVCVFLQDHLNNGTGSHSTSTLAQFLVPHCRFTASFNSIGIYDTDRIVQGIPNFHKINAITHDAYWHTQFPFNNYFSMPPSFLPLGICRSQDLRREYFTTIRELVRVIASEVDERELLSFRTFLADSFPIHAAMLRSASSIDLLATVAYRLSSDHALDHVFQRENWSFMRTYTSLTPSTVEWDNHLILAQATRACIPAIDGSDLLKNVDYKFTASRDLRNANWSFCERISGHRFSEVVTSSIAY